MKITLINDPTQYHAHSFIREKIYSNFPIIMRDNIQRDELNFYQIKTLTQQSKILPFSILYKKQKALIGDHASFSPHLFYDELISNQALGFNISPQRLSLSPKALQKNLSPKTPPCIQKKLKNYTKSYARNFQYFEKNHALIDALFTSMPKMLPPPLPLNDKTQAENNRRILSLPIFTLTPQKGFCPSKIEDKYLQDRIKQKLRKSHYPEFQKNQHFQIGWFDGVRAAYLARYYQADAILLSHIELLDGLKEIKLCSGYLQDSEFSQKLTKTSWLKNKQNPIKAFLEKQPTWDQPTSELRYLNDYPAAFFKYIKRIEEIANCPVAAIVSCANYTQIIPTSFPSIF